MARAHQAEEFDDNAMTPGQHVEELRTCLIRALYGILVGIIACFLLRAQILSLLRRPFVEACRQSGINYDLVTFRPQEAFLTVAKLAVLGGLIVSAPWWIWHLWQFIGSGLLQKERRWAGLFAAFGSLCFFGGVYFLYAVILKLCLTFFIGFAGSLSMAPPPPVASPETQPAPMIVPAIVGTPDASEFTDGQARIWYDPLERGFKGLSPDGKVLSLKTTPGWSVQPMYSLREYVDLALGLAFAFGVAFMLPVAVLLLATLDLVSVAGLSRSRRYVIFAAVVVGAILTPPDIVSQIALALPLVLLYEVGILMARVVEWRRRKAALAEADDEEDDQYEDDDYEDEDEDSPED